MLTMQNGGKKRYFKQNMYIYSHIGSHGWSIRNLLFQSLLRGITRQNKLLRVHFSYCFIIAFILSLSMYIVN